MKEVIDHYDKLIDENNDPIRDPKPLREYMDKWGGEKFIESMRLDKTKSVLEIGVGTGRIAIKTAPLCRKFIGIDGRQHLLPEHKEADELRKVVLATWGISVLRYSNDSIRNNFNAVAEDILKHIGLNFCDLKFVR